MSGEHERAQPQYADPDYSPPEQPKAPHLNLEGATLRTPPQRVARPLPRGSVETTDAQGRKITIRKLGALERMDLFELLGPALSDNTQYVGNAMSAVCVTSIDGIPVASPTNKKALRRLVEQLGDDGMEAATAAYREHFAAGETAEVADVKN
jgi:hypothetical protein